MTMQYSKITHLAIKKLTDVHNQKKSSIRSRFLQKEYNFFKKHIKNQRVLVAGSGLGHDSFEIAKNNKQTVGIEILKTLVNIARKEAGDKKIKNIKFRQGDFTKIEFPNKSFDSAILNMGTINGFNHKERTKIIKELLRVAHTVYFDFYTAQKLKTRKKMHEGDGWLNVKIKNNKIISDDGLYSEPVSKNEIKKIANSINAIVKFYPLCEFAIMAEIKYE